MKKKLQVFVSSTYTDLREERQAAVEAILLAGHIPAGMELFAAGDESQLETIKRWIKNSDVYLLLLGGRYGSLDPKSGKSYTQLEFEYALELGKPHFSLVIEEGHLEAKLKDRGSSVIERENPQMLKAFRETVRGKVVRHWADPRDIKLAIMETLAGFEDRADLIGWVPGDQAVNGAGIAEELARLTKENAELRTRVQAMDSVPLSNGLTFQETCSELEKSEVRIGGLSGGVIDAISGVLERFGDAAPHAGHVLWVSMNALREGVPAYPFLASNLETASQLGLVDRNSRELSLTEDGARFVRRYRIERRSREAEAFILPHRNLTEALSELQKLQQSIAQQARITTVENP